MTVTRASIRVLAGAIFAATLTGCASSYEVVRMPQREADLYPLSQTKQGITIAIDEIKGAERAERYFGADLVKVGILPLMVVVSNYGEHPVMVKPSDILLHRGREIIDPLPIEAVQSIAKSQHWFLRSKTEQQIDEYFQGVMFAETSLPPQDTYQGVLFFSMPKPPKRRDSLFMISNLFREGGPKVVVGVTQMETQDRLHFGPFSLSVPEDVPVY